MIDYVLTEEESISLLMLIGEPKILMKSAS